MCRIRPCKQLQCVLRRVQRDDVAPDQAPVADDWALCSDWEVPGWMNSGTWRKSKTRAAVTGRTRWSATSEYFSAALSS
ncbi:protein of unknown function [Pararobbsia alpina]